MKLSLPLLLLTAACGAPAATKVGDVTTRDSAGIIIIEYPESAVAMTPTWQLGDLITTLGGEEADAIHDMTGAEVGLLEDTGFLIGDQSSMHLRRFAPSGELLGSAGGRGEGPGELNSIGALFATTDGFGVVDISRDVLALYNDSLQFHQQVILQELPGGVRYGVFAADSDGSLYALGGPYAYRAPSSEGDILRDHRVVERVAPERDVVDTLFSLLGGEFYYIGSGARVRRFALRSFLHRTPGGFVSGDGERWEFQARDQSGDVRRIVRLDWPRRPVTELMREAQLKLDHLEIDQLPAGGFKGIRRIAELDFADPRFPDSLPPIDASRLGRDGTLWLREGGAPTDSLQHWFVFRGDTLLGRLQMPAHLVLLDARHDRLLLRRTDSLDLGYVELRSVRAKP